MNVRIFQTTQQANIASAWAFISRAISPQYGLIGIATGDTTKAVYQIIADVYNTAPFDTSSLRICAVDDYCDIEKGHIASCASRVRAQVQEPLQLRDDQVYLPDSYTGDPEEVAQLYEKHLNDLGGIKTQFLGIGGDGHLGFCRPGTPFSSLAQAVLLPDDTRNMLHTKYGLEADCLPKYGITLGLTSIMRIPEIIVIATGEKKATAVRASLKNHPSESVPASILQFHPNVTWILDSSAAALL